MFSKNSVPACKPFNLTYDRIIEDIEVLYKSEEERNKLYFCLDEKPPQESRFAKLEDLLRGSDDLEATSGELTRLAEEINGKTIKVKELLTGIKKESQQVLDSQ